MPSPSSNPPITAMPPVIASDDIRTNFKSFWDKYSGKPDNCAMMLNNNADELESSDRADILSVMPNIVGKDAVDIGAGIGRFTTVLAETARHVLSTDFIDEFIKKNKERNSHLENVDFAVGDAVHLDLSTNSVDFVFTNWLMMYMTDKETVEFVLKAIGWLRPAGYIHLRESCSEPSTGRRVDKDQVSMHDSGAVNPTSYRFSSLYINLLRAVRYRDESGALWRFDLHWSCSVPTYIKRMSNWRQVHWLCTKVKAEDSDVVPTFDELLKSFATTWNEEQAMWDTKLDGETSTWTDKLLTSSLSSSLHPADQSTVFIYTPRTISPYTHVNAHLIAERFNANVWNVERVPMFYRTSLTKATSVKDQRVRFSWHPSLQYSVDYWVNKSADFDALVATELLSTAESDEELQGVKSILKPGVPIVLLEPVRGDIDEAAISKRLTSLLGARDVKITDVTEQAVEAQKAYYKERNLAPETLDVKWALIEATAA